MIDPKKKNGRQRTKLTLAMTGLLTFMGNTSESFAKIIKYEPFETASSGELRLNQPYTSDSPFKMQHFTDYGFATPLMGTNGMPPMKGGKRAARFEMRLADKGVSGNVRSEAASRSAETSSERWYGLSMYFPKSSWTVTNSNYDIITQFWALPDSDYEQGRNPPIDLYVKNGQFNIGVSWTAKALAAPGDRQMESKPVGPVITDRWVDFVYHIKHSYKEDGLLQVWIDGKLVIDRKGPNHYNDKSLPWFKFGIYNYAKNSRVHYVDEVRVGDATSSYNEVRPQGGTVVNPPEEPKAGYSGAVTSLSLIDSKSGKVEVADIAASQKILIDPAGKCLNIRANTNSTVGSVGFSLNGNAGFSTQSGAPYDLMGDYSEKGCLTVGGHTIIATPYSQANKAGEAGTALSRTFQIALPVVEQPSTSLAISSLTLIDAKSGQVYAASISDKQTIRISSLSSKCVDVRANVSGKAGSVAFDFSGKVNFGTENGAPYDLMGNSGSRGCLKAGTHTILAKPYSGASRAGTLGKTMLRTITITN